MNPSHTRTHTIAMLHCKVVAPLPSKWKLIVGDTAMLLESLGKKRALNSKWLIIDTWFSVFGNH